MSHLGNKEYEYLQCGKTLKTKQTLQTHHMSHSGKSLLGALSVKNSSHSLVTWSHMTWLIVARENISVLSVTHHSCSSNHLKIHINTQNKVKQYYCAQCEMSFSHFSNLKRHKMTHTQEKGYLCQQCDKSFSLLNSLKRHKVTHTGDKGFLWVQCEKSFSLYSSLKTHTKTHSGEKGCCSGVKHNMWRIVMQQNNVFCLVCLSWFFYFFIIIISNCFITVAYRTEYNPWVLIIFLTFHFVTSLFCLLCVFQLFKIFISFFTISL